MTYHPDPRKDQQIAYHKIKSWRQGGRNSCIAKEKSKD